MIKRIARAAQLRLTRKLQGPIRVSTSEGPIDLLSGDVIELENGSIWCELSRELDGSLSVKVHATASGALQA